MADPLSVAGLVAGLAAGLVSLGLQVCGGITQYLDALDCRDQDMVSVRQQTISLQNTLRAVEPSLAQLQSDHQAAAAAVHDCIAGCKSELRALLTLVTDLTGCDQPPRAGRRDKLKSQGKKLLYPFSRPKLNQLETRLRNANGAFQLALQTLGL